MHNIIAILKRDFLRLVKTPAALVVVLALLVIPSLYSWYNILGFWDPYENTSHMRVAVVNQDKGASNELTGQLNMGDSIVESLEENDQLNWVFEDYETAYNNLLTGKNFAIFVIPESFTQDTLSVTTEQFTQPKIQYYVNMKTGPVAPKITDTGSITLEGTINATFVETVSDVVIENLGEDAVLLKDKLTSSTTEAVQDIDAIIANLVTTQTRLTQMNTALTNAQENRTLALDALDDAEAALGDANTNLDEVSQKSADLQADLADITPQAMQSLNDAITALYQLNGVAQAGGFEADFQVALSALEECSALMFGTAVPAITSEMGTISSNAAQLSVAIEAQKDLIEQTRTILLNLDTVLTNAQAALSQTTQLLEDAQANLSSIRDDLLSLSASNAISSLVEKSQIDAEDLAHFIGSPTLIKTESIFTPNSYGAAMAPLFMNLSFWIGAFMLLVILRKEADSEGVDNLSFTQRYLSRFSLFAIFAILQALICCTGVLALGVKAANPFALFLGAAMTSLAYLSIIYALSVTLQHIGMGLCIILVFMQIPAATGIYPIEMTSSFYQAICPAFPFTYGIEIMREAICGFYGNVFVKDVAILLIYFGVFMALGLLLRPTFANINLSFAKQLEESGLINTDVMAFSRQQIRETAIARTLANNDEYQTEINERYRRFETLYPKLKAAAIAVGLCGPIVLNFALNLTPDSKAILLTAWLILLVVVFIFLSMIEHMRESLKQQKQASSSDANEDESDALQESNHE